MFSDKLISESSVLNRLDFDEFIEISEENGQKLTDLTLRLIQSLSHFNFNSNLIEQKIKLLKFEKERADFLKTVFLCQIQKIAENLYELRKIVFLKELNDLTTINKIDWRFQIQVASKTCKNTFNPNIIMHLNLKNQFQSVLFGQNKKNQNFMFNMDFANLKNLQYQLNQALKMHNNPKMKVAKNSTV